MTTIKVLYVDQTSGKVEDSLLDDLIAKGEIVAFCSSRGWIDVRSEQRSGITVVQSGSNEKERGHETSRNKGNRHTKGVKSWKDEKK